MLFLLQHLVGTLVSPIEGLKQYEFLYVGKKYKMVGTLVSPIEGLKHETCSQGVQGLHQSERL